MCDNHVGGIGASCIMHVCFDGSQVCVIIAGLYDVVAGIRVEVDMAVTWAAVEEFPS
jgi:hypothetical protein